MQCRKCSVLFVYEKKNQCGMKRTSKLLYW